MTLPSAWWQWAQAATKSWPLPQCALAPRAAVLMARRLAEADDPRWPQRLEGETAAMLGVHGALLAAWIQARRRGQPWRVGIAGGQGSGKSTLTGLIAAMLEAEYGLRVAVLGLDDLYLPQARRLELARQVHPLFATRGVPGTHDVELGLDLCQRLFGPAAEVALPRFDKGRDDRLEPGQWPRLEAPVDVLLFEGWCVGAEPQTAAELALPCNDLERQEDADGRWRQAVNAALAGPYANLFAGLDALLLLRVPDFAAVRRWREQQEAELRRHSPGAMAPAAVQRFIDHYQRLTEAQLRRAPGRVDLLLDLDAEHRIAAVHPGGAWRGRGFRRDSAPAQHDGAGMSG